MSQDNILFDEIQRIQNMAASEMKVRDLASWMHENLPMKAMDGIAPQLVGMLLGSSIGAWIDAGATKDQINKYLSRLVDVIWYARYGSVDNFSAS
jgi:hypothetical protein